MSKIVRLTESDLNRIVKRVIKEQKTSNCDLNSLLKVKFFDDEKLNDFSFNADILKRKFNAKENRVEFTFKGAGRSEYHPAYIKCDSTYVLVESKGETWGYFLNPESLKKIKCGCDEYVSSDVKPSSIA